MATLPVLTAVSPSVLILCSDEVNDYGACYSHSCRWPRGFQPPAEVIQSGLFDVSH